MRAVAARARARVGSSAASSSKTSMTFRMAGDSCSSTYRRSQSRDRRDRVARLAPLHAVESGVERSDKRLGVVGIATDDDRFDVDVEGQPLRLVGDDHDRASDRERHPEFVERRGALPP